MQLIYSKSGKPVQVGDVVHVKRKPYTIQSITPPHKPSSTGRVWCISMCDNRYSLEWFPGVINAEWVGRDDQ
jgi:hypothetical protein